MAIKREDITGMINQSIEERKLEPQARSAGKAKAERFIPPEKEKVTVRLDVGDYQKLQRIGAERGTTASALIRQAIKGILRGDGDKA